MRIYGSNLFEIAFNNFRFYFGTRRANMLTSYSVVFWADYSWLE